MWLIQLRYADEIVIFAKSIKELEKMIHIFNEEFKRFGLPISITKTKTMCFNGTQETIAAESLVTLNNQPIGNVQKFIYLGHTVTNIQSNQSEHIAQRISSAYSKWNELKHVLTDKRTY